MATTRLLLIDDDLIVNFLLKMVLEEIALPVQEEFKQSAQEAITYLKACQERNEFPSRILVDLKMPMMDGFEFIDYYQAQFLSHFPQTYLFVLSSSVSEQDKSRALQYKAVKGFITKPLEAENLLHVLSDGKKPLPCQ